MRWCVGLAVIAVSCTCGLSLGGTPAAVSAESSDGGLTVVYEFDRPEVSKVTIDGVEYDRISVQNCTSSGNIGAPALPVCGARILLPLGAEVADVRIAGKTISLGDGFYVEPVAQPVRLSDGSAGVVLPMPNPAIYGLAAPFPAAAFEEIGIHGFRGYQVLTLKLSPLVYVPTTGELSYYPRLEIVVSTTATRPNFIALPRIGGGRTDCDGQGR